MTPVINFDDEIPSIIINNPPRPNTTFSIKRQNENPAFINNFNNNESNANTRQPPPKQIFSRPTTSFQIKD
jgi:hypothetical protein